MQRLSYCNTSKIQYLCMLMWHKRLSVNRGSCWGLIVGLGRTAERLVDAAGLV